MAKLLSSTTRCSAAVIISPSNRLRPQPKADKRDPDFRISVAKLSELNNGMIVYAYTSSSGYLQGKVRAKSLRSARAAIRKLHAEAWFKVRAKSTL
jgi:hypothetical protein